MLLSKILNFDPNQMLLAFVSDNLFRAAAQGEVFKKEVYKDFQSLASIIVLCLFSLSGFVPRTFTVLVLSETWICKPWEVSVELGENLALVMLQLCYPAK